MRVVIVESPAKAKTINKYLGSDYQVLASYGHVRDLPPKDGSVRPDEDFAMDWEVESRGEKRLKEIAAAVRNADGLILATDPDREGEAISWHIREELARRRALNGTTVQRVVFNEVTKRAVLEAFEHPRELDGALVEAYLARRALDYLVGFTLSPILWRKLPGSRSAGRVQSVALRLICEREAEIEVFKPQEFWTVDVALSGQTGAFEARLSHLAGEKLGKFGLPDETSAKAAVATLEGAEAFRVASVERKQTRRHPQPPFTTSTLQQEASRKLGFGATRTMRLAQNLYEGLELDGETVGLITYMRTDGVQVSGEAIAAARDLIGKRHGPRYVPDAPRRYSSKAKNAQEAHEAIRPTDLARTPDSVRGKLEPDALRLYDLIWKRTLASQMASAELDQVTVEIDVDRDRARLRATGSTVTFDGFLALYQEGVDDPKENGKEGAESRLPPLAEGAALERQGVTPAQHFTQPPPRYSEASLVKRLEELGIGRPSTYASILQVLQDRDYVRLDKRRFVPEDRGRMVTAFLSSFFHRYVEYDFTAELENKLDDISGGRLDWKSVLREFWAAFKDAVDQTSGLRIGEVIEALDEDLGSHFFPPREDGKDPRTCPACGAGRLGLRLGRSGGFIGCSNYPECRFTRPLAVANGETEAEGELALPKQLGKDPETGLPVTLRKGPYGLYVQLGEAGEEGEKPKRSSLPKGMDAGELTLEQALALLALPREVGAHPESGETILAGIGRYGPYLKHGRAYVSLKGDDDVLTIGLNRAVTLIAEAAQKKGNAPGKPLGDHPGDGQPVTLHEGRYGPYVKHGRLNASLPKGEDPNGFGLEAAIALLARQAEKKGKTAKSGGKAGGKPATARKKTAAKPKAAKKPTAKTGAKTAAKSKAKSAETESA